MNEPDLERLLIEAAARHLPPSGAVLRLLDVGGRAGAVLGSLRADLDLQSVPVPPADWLVTDGSADAVVAFDCLPEASLLQAALAALRPGGRLVIVLTDGQPGETQVQTLELAGYVRILVEPGAQIPEPVGALLRGEKPHTEARTLDRVRQVAGRDDPARASRYVYLLIEQTPNKPSWMLQAGEPVAWQAAAVSGDAETVLLAFSSLPKAVEFMQPAVMAGRVLGVNKVAKFRWEVVREWPAPVILNPTDDILETNALIWVAVDPRQAEVPDE